MSFAHQTTVGQPQSRSPPEPETEVWLPMTLAFSIRAKDKVSVTYAREFCYVGFKYDVQYQESAAVSRIQQPQEFHSCRTKSRPVCHSDDEE